MAMQKCPKCAGTDIDQGTLVSAGSTAYKTKKHKLIFKDNCDAYLCMNCGYVELFVNEEYRRKIKESA